MARVLTISFTDLGRDARVDRQISFLCARHDVVAAGLGPPQQSVEFIDLTPPPAASPLRLARRALGAGRVVARRYDAVYWHNAAIRWALAQLAGVDCDLVIANDVSALALGARVAAGRPLILDAHEYAPAESAEHAWWRLLMSPYVDHQLRAGLPAVAEMMTVSDGIAALYSERYGKHPAVVTNAPPAAALEPTAVHDPVRVLHHGIADRARRLEDLIVAMELLGGSHTLDLRLVPGSQRYLDQLRKRAAGTPFARVLDPLPTRELVSAANDYDVGVHLLAARHPNERFALPNKLFEFIQARLAVIVGPTEEMARVVRAHDCGVVAEGFTAQALARALQSLSADQIGAFKRGSDRAARVLNAERNQGLVLDLVARALAAPRRGGRTS